MNPCEPTTQQKEETVSESEIIQTLPVLPIKNALLFPYIPMTLSVGRPTSLAAVDAAMANEGKQIIVVAQRETTRREYATCRHRTA